MTLDLNGQPAGCDDAPLLILGPGGDYLCEVRLDKTPAWLGPIAPMRRRQLGRAVRACLAAALVFAVGVVVGLFLAS